jgi:hypothetical protein
MRPKAECDCGGVKSGKFAENTIEKSGFFENRTPTWKFGLRPHGNFLKKIWGLYELEESVF